MHSGKFIFRSIAAIVMVVILSLAFSQDVRASHAMGSDLTYRYIGPGPTPGSMQYILTFSFYRDCTGSVTPGNPLDIQVTNGCGLSNPNVNLPLLDTNQITPICATAQSTCNGGPYNGVEEWIFQDTVTLPGYCGDWTFSHSEGVRNAAITTVTNPTSYNLYVFTVINNSGGIQNSSPTFSNKPVPFACDSQRFCFNHGAYDIEGDSLTYQIITPRYGPAASDTIIYKPGYSASQPVISNPSMSFNAATGDFCMNPIQQDVTVLAVLVNEYRNGVLIGQVERDIQLTVLACSNTLPQLSGMNGIPRFKDSVCVGNQLCFYLRAIDPDALNNTFITWDQSIPGATWHTSGSHRDSAFFCWTPNKSDASEIPYCFTATVTDDNCPYLGVQVYSYCIKVLGAIPDAGPDQTIPCGATTNLSGSATGGSGIYTYTWDPGGINSQTLNNIGIGTYYLSVASDGCTSVDTVEVLPGNGVPVANFSYSTGCSGTNVQFTDSSTVVGSTISGWTWNFGDGNTSTTQSPSHLYAANSTYTVTLTVSTPTNCTSTLIRQVVVNSNVPTAQFNAANVCDGGAMNFFDNSTGGTMNAWSWDFDDPTSGSNTSTSQNPTHTFTAPGTYSVSLSVTNTDGCQNQQNQNVTVHANPVVVVVNTGMCSGAQATLNGPAGYSNYSWSGGQTTQSITVSPASNTVYTLTATDPNGCIGSDTALVAVDPLPVPDAGTVQTICEGTNANLSGLGGNIYTWNPGNIVGQNVVVTPAVTTIYTLTAAFNSGCSANDTVTVYVNPMPNANVGNDEGICSGETITITSNAVGNILWTPGNYNTQNITVTPPVSTTYVLTVSDAIGCTGTDSITITVNPLPVAAFVNPAPVCGSNTIIFADGSSVTTGNIASWFWDFGDGQTSNAQSPSITYSTPGNYNVFLRVTTNAGCLDSTNSTQIIWASPVAAYAHTDACDGVPISFTNGSTIIDGSPLAYNWDLGDSFTSTSLDVTHQYASFGTYSATLLVTSNNGCVDSIISPVNVYSLPQAAYNLSYACEDQPAGFNDASTIPQGSISSWFWTFGDSNSSTNQSPTHTYADAGDYNIHMLVTSDHGCQDSTDGIIRIVPKPIVDFLTENACQGFPVNLTDQSQPVTGPIVQYIWDFGDGSTSNVQNPQHIYMHSGYFDVTLTATTDSGCTTTLTKQDAVNIFAPPPVYFSSNASVADDVYPLVNFVNETGVNGFYLWNFGDGDTSTRYSPTHLYPHVGNYDVQLIAMDLNGCVDSILIEIEIKHKSNIFIPNAFTPNGDAQNDLFRVYSNNIEKMDVQIFDRWGIKIYEWKDLFGYWDGKVDGKPAQSDTYVYRVSTVDINAVEEVRVGHVSLVR